MKIMQIQKIYLQLKMSEEQEKNIEMPTSTDKNLEYDDGKVEEKVYGNQDDTLSHKIMVHMINRENEHVQTHILNAQNSLTFKQCINLLEEEIKQPFNNLRFLDHLEGKDLPQNTTITEFCSEKQPIRELYVFYDAIKAMVKEKVAEIKYESLTKYSFLDDKKYVKVYIEMEGIGSLAPENITSRFLERSIEVKVHNFKKKNWIFAVPRTQCMVKTSDSTIMIKSNKLIIKIGKVADADNWHSLHKVKAVGEKDDF